MRLMPCLATVKQSPSVRKTQLVNQATNFLKTTNIHLQLALLTMKFSILAAAFLPLVSALQGDYLSQLSPKTQAPAGGKAFVPGGSAFFPQAQAPAAPAPPAVGGAAYRDGGKIFYPDPATTPSNPLSTRQGVVTNAPDCTTPPTWSTLNKGTYERLNGGPGQGYLLPDPANTPSNPLATNTYSHYPGTGGVPDCTKPATVSMLNKGTYERLNGGPGEGYLLPDPANTPSNPLTTRQGVVTNAPDCTTPPTWSTLNKGTYERLNGYQNPVAINRENPFSRGF